MFSFLRKNFESGGWSKPTEGGYAIITAVLFFLFVGSTAVFGLVGTVTRELAAASSLIPGKQAFYVAESGVEDAVFRLKAGLTIGATEVVNLDGVLATTTISDISGGKSVKGDGEQADFFRHAEVSLASGSGAAFHYGVQVGAGGVSLNNSSSVSGNLYSDGPIVGTSNNLVRGDAVSSGASGSISGIRATSSAYAHTISNSTIDGEAYYVSISNTTVSGSNCVNNPACHPNSPDQESGTLPISDAQISEWESEALSGGTVTCSGGSYNISGTSSVTIGPKKIPCDLHVSNNGDLILTGNLWVTGNIYFSNDSDVIVHSSLSGKTVAIIADKTTNRTSSSQIFVSNNAEFIGSGSNSYILLISQNNSAELGGNNPAINVSNSISGKVLIYAPHGLVYLSNSIQIKEVTAYKLQMSNSAQVIYETGLANLLFSSGPSGGYTITGWQEVE